LIWQFKFKSRQKAGEILTTLLFEAISDIGYSVNDSILVPIPLFPKRLRERGFNQAEKIADYLSDKLNLKKVSCLLRVKNTTPQSEISDYKQRRVNIAHAFEIKKGSGPFDKRIFLIDDVWTSGATMSEAVSVLKNAGAGEIIAMVVARAH
jgi:ComF family protein